MLHVFHATSGTLSDGDLLGGDAPNSLLSVWPIRNLGHTGSDFAFFSPMNSQPSHADNPGLQRDPDEWKTGDEPMTAAQSSYLETLARETGEEFDDTLSKAEASKRIDELRQRSPRIAEAETARQDENA